MLNFRLIIVFISLNTSFFAQMKNTELAGKWHYLRSSGGITGKGPGYTKAEQVVFHFSKNGKYRDCRKGKQIQTLRFTLKSAAVSSDQGFNTLIQYSNSMTHLARRSGDTLYLKENVADGFDYVLFRK